MKKLLIQMTSGNYLKHCDILPHGSLHNVEVLEDGVLKIAGKTDYVPPGFSYKVVEENTATKECVNCQNKFSADWPFIGVRYGTDETSCIRCYERKVLVDREYYRMRVREEMRKETENFADVVSHVMGIVCDSGIKIETIKIITSIFTNHGVVPTEVIINPQADLARHTLDTKDETRLSYAGYANHILTIDILQDSFPIMRLDHQGKMVFICSYTEKDAKLAFLQMEPNHV